MSRAFGDLHYRKYGLTAHPELRWHNTSAADRWLILVSDGVLEKVSEDDVCQVAMSAEHGVLLQSCLDRTAVGCVKFHPCFECASAAWLSDPSRHA